MFENNKKSKKAPTLEEIKESMNQMRIKEYIDSQIEELNDLSKSNILISNFNYENLDDFDASRTAYCIFLLAEEELKAIKDLIKILNFDDHQVKIEFANARFPDGNANVLENMIIKYHVVLSGKEEQLWFFNAIFGGDWLELYLAFEYEKEHRYDIFPESFLGTLDYIKENSWGTKEYILPDIRNKIREISKFLNKPENKIKGMVLPKMNFSLLFTPYHNHRINEYERFGRVLREYISAIFVDTKKNNMNLGWFEDVRDLSIYYKAINIGEQAIKKYALKELKKINTKDIKDIEIINNKYLWLEELTEVLNHEIKNSDFTEVEISNIRRILKNYFVDPNEIEEEEEVKEEVKDSNFLKALLNSNLDSDDFRKILGDFITEALDNLDNKDIDSLEDESGIKVIKVNAKDLPKELAGIVRKINKMKDQEDQEDQEDQN